MTETDKGKVANHWLGLYPRDARRLRAVCSSIEEKTGRPCSATTAVIFLLDCLDEQRKLDSIIKAEMEGLTNGKARKSAHKAKKRQKAQEAV